MSRTDGVGRTRGLVGSGAPRKGSCGAGENCRRVTAAGCGSRAAPACNGVDASGSLGCSGATGAGSGCRVIAGGSSSLFRSVIGSVRSALTAGRDAGAGSGTAASGCVNPEITAAFDGGTEGDGSKGALDAGSGGAGGC